MVAPRVTELNCLYVFIARLKAYESLAARFLYGRNKTCMAYPLACCVVVS